MFYAVLQVVYGCSMGVLWVVCGSGSGVVSMGLLRVFFSKTSGFSKLGLLDGWWDAGGGIGKGGLTHQIQNGLPKCFVLRICVICIDFFKNLPVE